MEFPSGSVKVISGKFNGLEGPGKPHTGMLYYDIFLKPNEDIRIPIENGWNGFCYVYEGKITCNKIMSKGHLGVLSTKGIFACNSENKDSRFLLIAGEPLNEPVARGGPFVMNTKSEVIQAFKDYHSGILD